MSNALQNIADLVTANTGKKDRLFKYELSNSVYGVLELQFAPDGWKSGELTYTRDEVYGGVFRRYSTNELLFVKDARDYLQSVYEAQGISAACSFTVSILNKSNFEYAEYFTGLIDFTTYRIEEVGVRVSVIDDSFTEKFKSRDEIALNILDDTGIDGGVFPAIAIKDLQLKQKTQYITASYDDSGTLSTVYVPASPPTLPGPRLYIIPQMRRVAAELEESVVEPGPVVYPINDAAAFLVEAKEDYNLLLSGSLSLTLVRPTAGQIVLIAELWTNQSGSWAKVTNLDAQAKLVYTTPASFNFDLSWTDEAYTLPAGASVALLIVAGTGPVTSVTVNDFSFVCYRKRDLQQTIVTAVPAYEAFWKLAQKITGNSAPIRSDLFGRTDTPNFYPVDGEVPFITRGGLVRKTAADPGTLAISFRDLFHAMHKIYRIGVGVEVSAGKKLRIEAEDYFYDSTVVLDLSDRVREEALTKEVMPDLHYNEIKSGYSAYDYASSGGLLEYNTRSIYSTSINNLKRSLDLIGPFRADTSGLDKIRVAVANGEVGNTEGDKDIWLIDARKDGTAYTARRGFTADGFALVSGGLGAEEGFNLRFTPKRNLLRWGRHIKAGLSKYLGTYLRWQTSERFTGLVTRLTTEVTPVTESADQLVKLLDPNRFYPEKYIFEAPLYWADIQAIEAKPTGLIKIGDNKYGWILSVQTNSRERKAQFELLRANIRVVTPT